MAITLRALWVAVIVTAVAAAPSAAQEGADLAGSWTLTFTSTQGTVNLPVQLTPDGATLRGTSGSALGYRTDFEAGRITADGFTFDIFVEVGGDWFPVSFSGRLEGDQLTGNVNIPDGTRASFTGTRTEGG